MRYVQARHPSMHCTDQSVLCRPIRQDMRGLCAGASSVRAFGLGLGADEQQLAAREVQQRGVPDRDPCVPACDGGSR